MAFSLSSSTITQTGTDSDLSGLQSITGVTYSVINGSGTMPNRKVYDLASLRLNIQGILNHDPSKEVLIFKGGNNNNERIFIDSGGVYNYGTETTFRGGTHYTTGEGLIIRSYYTGSQRQWRPETAGMQIRGDFNWKGGTIVSGRSIIAEQTGTITVRDGIFKPWATSLSQKDYCPRIGLDGADADIDGLEVYGYNGHFFGFALSSDVLTNFTNISIQGTTDFSAAIAGDSTATGSGQPHAQIKNIPSLANGNLYSGRAWQNRVNVWTNYGGGVNLKDELSDTTNTAPASKGLVIAQKEVSPTVVGTDGLPVQNVKILVKEESDGNEATSSDLSAYNDSDLTHYAAARNQIETTNASGQTNTITSGLVLCYKFNNTDLMQYNVKTISGTNEQTSRQFGYDYLLNEGRLNMSGTGVLQPTFTMIQDVNVTATKAVADAYTELNTAAQIYDRSKSYLYDNWAGEGSLITTKEGEQINIGSTNLNIDGTAASAFAYSTDITIKSSTFTAGVKGAGTVTVSNGVTLDGGTFDSTMIYSVGASTITDVTATSIDFTQAGTYNLVGTNIGTVTNSSGGAITLVLDDSSSVTTNTGPNITLQTNQTVVNFNNLEAGSQLVMYTAGTTTELFRVNSTSTTEQFTNAASVNFDFTVQKAGFFPIRQTGISATAAAATSINAQQTLDRAYAASSGLNNTNVTVNTTAKTIDITTSTTVQNAYSYLIEAWINESSLRNIQFPVSTFGSSSFSLDLDYEFTSSTISNLSRDGFRYTNSGNVKAIYAAILSQGVTAGLQAEYVQTQGGTVVDAQNTGNVDQVIKIFGDANNGNFDYRGHLIFKVQANGYRQAEADVVATYGNLEATLYVIALATNTIDLTLGDPSITGITLTDDTAAPVSFDVGDGQSLSYSFTITDTNNNSGEDILRHFNYLLSTDGTLNGLDVFQFPEMILDNGAAYETVRGVFRKSSGDTTVGVRVIRGTEVHPDFTRLQSDNGTYGVVPVFSVGSVTNIESGSRLRIYNETTSTEVINQIVNATSYSVEYTDGTDYTDGDTISVRLTYQSGTSAKLGFEATTIVGASGWSVLANQQDDEIYNTIGVDGSLVTEFSNDFVNNEIDIVVAANFTAHRLYARYVYFLTLEDGIRLFFGAVTALDLGNFRNNVDILDMYFNNNTAANLVQTDNVRLFKSDGTYPARTNTTGGGGIDVVWRNTILIAETGVSGLTAQESSQLAELDKLEGIEKLTKLIPASL